MSTPIIEEHKIIIDGIIYEYALILPGGEIVTGNPDLEKYFDTEITKVLDNQ